MNEWWLSLSALQHVMFVIGAATLLFMVAQIIMLLIGMGGHEMSVEADLSGLDSAGDLSADAELAPDTDVSSDADAADGGEVCAHPEGMEHLHVLGLRLLSLRCIIAFCCFAAWTIFIMDGYMQWYFAALVGVGVGLAAAVGMALILGEMMKLQRDGTIRLKNCVGKSAEVYLTIPAARTGEGKVNVLVQESLTEFNAVTDDDEPIPTGDDVRVLKAEEGVLVVERLSERNRQSRAGGN